MSVTVKWTGLEEFLTELQNLPSDLADEASEIVVGAATSAFNEIHSTYPERSGNLRDHVKLEVRSLGPYGAGMTVKSTAKHAYIYELGTVARYYTGTDTLGRVSDQAERGIMPVTEPPGKVFVPVAIRWRREMYRGLMELLRRHGANVLGGP